MVLDVVLAGRGLGGALGRLAPDAAGPVAWCFVLCVSCGWEGSSVVGLVREGGREGGSEGGSEGVSEGVKERDIPQNVVSKTMT